MHYISKIITNIRNAKNSKLNYIIYSINEKAIANSMINILTILRNNGVIRAFSYVPTDNKNKFIIYIKYDYNGNKVIRSIFNVSKPSRILYTTTKSL